MKFAIFFIVTCLAISCTSAIPCGCDDDDSTPPDNSTPPPDNSTPPPDNTTTPPDNSPPTTKPVPPTKPSTNLATSPISPGGSDNSTLPREPTSKCETTCCPPCNYSCPAKQCSCYYPGTKKLLKPRKVNRPANCKPCPKCQKDCDCRKDCDDRKTKECTFDQIERMIQYDSL